MDVDPYGFIVDLCKHSTSQEDLLHSRFINESQEKLGFFPGEDSTQADEFPVASTGIMICSVPENLNNDNSQDEFQTPPEESLLVLSSDEQQRIDPDKLVNLRTEGVDVVDDSPDLGFSSEKSSLKKGFLVPRTDGFEDFVDGIRAAKLKEIVVFKGKSLAMEELEFSESKDEGLGDSPSKIERNLESRSSLRVVDDSGELAGKSLLEKRDILCDPSSREEIESNSLTPLFFPGNSATEFLQSEPNDEDSPLKAPEKDLELGTGTERIDNFQTEEIYSDPEGDSTRKNTEELENFGPNNSNDLIPEVAAQGISGRREVPPSILGPMDNAPDGMLLRGSTSSKRPQVMNLMDAINKISGERKHGSEDVDILEIAKQHGITFPRPRWWRKPEGYRR